MKVQSKKDFPYAVYTNKDTNKTNKVCVFISETWDVKEGYEFVVINDEKTANCDNMLFLESDNLNCPIISFNTWESLPDEEFVLPENWCIQGSSELFDYLQSIRVNFLGSDNSKLYYIDSKGIWDFFEKNSINKYFYNQITLDQFREYVLKEIPKPEYDPKDVAFNQRNVIGYKLIKPEYKEAVRAIINDAEYCEYTLSGKEWIIKENTIYRSASEVLKESGVLNLWFETLYDNSITLKSGVTLSEEDIAEVKEIFKNK